MRTRHRHLTVLAVVVLAQLLLLAHQLRRQQDIPLIRHGTALLITPVQKVLRLTSDGVWSVWYGYVELWTARRENQDLQREVNSLRLEQQWLRDQAEQARRLQVLLDLKQQSPAETMAAQVIGSGAGETARLLMIDKGRDDGLRPDMPVLAPEGIVGKVLHVFPRAAQVLLLTDAHSGVACLIENSRIHGVLKGRNQAVGALEYVHNDETVELGAEVVTSGEDRIYPKGLPVGVVVSTKPGAAFQEIQVQPFAKLNRLEEVLVIVKKAEEAPSKPAEDVAGLRPENSVGVARAGEPQTPAVLPLRAAEPARPQVQTGNPTP